MTDADVVRFFRNGYWILEAVVPDEVNRCAMDYLASNTHWEPTEIMNEDWFVDGVILNAEAAGAVRSLLGNDFAPPTLLPGSHFRCQRQKLMAQYGTIKGGVFTTAPAGSIFITTYNIWHRRAARTAPTEADIRNLLTYNYWRTADP